MPPRAAGAIPGGAPGQGGAAGRPSRGAASPRHGCGCTIIAGPPAPVPHRSPPPGRGPGRPRLLPRSPPARPARPRPPALSRRRAVTSPRRAASHGAAPPPARAPWRSRPTPRLSRPGSSQPVGPAGRCRAPHRTATPARRPAGPPRPPLPSPAARKGPVTDPGNFGALCRAAEPRPAASALCGRRGLPRRRGAGPG